MSKFIRTRSAEQCRSHYQKYEQRCESFANIIMFIETKIEEDKLREAELPAGNQSDAKEDLKLSRGPKINKKLDEGQWNQKII